MHIRLLFGITSQSVSIGVPPSARGQSLVVRVCLPEVAHLGDARVCEPLGEGWQQARLADAWGAAGCLEIDLSALSRWLLKLRKRSPYVEVRDLSRLTSLKRPTPMAAA